MVSGLQEVIEPAVGPGGPPRLTSLALGARMPDLPNQYVVGIDLSGPASPERTAAVTLLAKGGHLSARPSECDGSDPGILGLVTRLSASSPVTVGLDAPLSYEPGGGQRRRDAELRKLIVARGLKPGSVMAPTFQKMAYLTLRGLYVARLLATVQGEFDVSVVEVHPGASFALSGAPIEAVRKFGSSSSARQALLQWLEGQDVKGVSSVEDASSHYVAACGCALAAWKWRADRTSWLAPAEFPWHPYDFAC